MIRLLQIVILVTAITIPVSGMSAERIRPDEPKIQCSKIRFNDETIKTYYLVIDARTPDEIEKNRKEGRLGGSLIVFFSGHAQRPNDAYGFSSELALKSKSGIVIVPVSDTPYGRDEKWRGDEGKTVILMELVRHILYNKDISVDGYKPISGMTITIDGEEAVPASSGKKLISAKIMAVCWSHGSILGRLCANKYPDAITDLAQTCPAGYSKWPGGGTCVGTYCLMLNFQIETTNICVSGMCVYPGDIISAGWGLTKGMYGDAFRAYPSCLGGNVSLFKLGRGFRDTAECTSYIDDSCCPTPRLKSITVIFGEDDTLFDPKGIMGVKNVKNITLEEYEKFWSKYYPAAVKSGSHLTAKVMPGNHLAPIVNYKSYAKTILMESGQEK